MEIRMTEFQREVGRQLAGYVNLAEFQEVLDIVDAKVICVRDLG